MREQLRALPWDIRLGYAIPILLAAWFIVCVFCGPDLLLLLSWCPVYPLLAVSALVIAVRLVFSPNRCKRILPLTLVTGCLATLLAAPRDSVVDLHLVVCVFLAGGPDAINGWAQGLIREQEGVDESHYIKPEEIPQRVRTYLPGVISVGGTLWSGQTRVRIELGGGFYHYGVVVFPTGEGPPDEWWQRILGWPPEMIVYHED